MLFKYIAFHYAKNMLIILVSLSLLFAGLDFLMTGTSLPSFNIQILYLFNRWQEALNLLYPLTIVFGGIWTKIAFIKKNTMSALYALGVSRIELFSPILIIAMVTYLFFLALNFTSFAMAKDIAESLKHGKYHASASENLFFKYHDSFVYIESLFPYENRLEGLAVFKLSQGKVVELIRAKSASYDGSLWSANEVTRQIKTVDANGTQRLEIEHLDAFASLEKYQPEILTSIYEQKDLTLFDSMRAKALLETQGIKTDKVLANVYGKIFMPLFAIALLMILLFRFPFHARYINIALISVKAIGVTLFVWGFLYSLQRIGSNSVLPPEVAILLPIALLWGYAIYTLNRAKNRI